ncbi:MAG: hypothetical protein JKX73_06745 [Flavobacteriales bacterium]|nr:hypothetical protein [Flavobacteriales bacterium]
MFSRIAIAFTLNLLLCLGLLAQEKSVELSIQFLSHDKIGDINFDVDDFAAHGKKAVDILEEFFAVHDKPQEIVVLETLYPNKKPTFTIHARPAMFVAEMDAVLKKLRKMKAVKAKYVKFHLAYILEIKGGPKDQKAPYVPNMKVPVQIEFETLEDSSLGGKWRMIQAWARDEVLPVLGAFANQADAKFIGIRGLGKVIADLDWDESIDPISLTERNPDYWRALIEMNPGNQLIPTTKIFLHVAAGEFDYIKLYKNLLPSFADPKSIAGYFLKELKWRLEIFDAELEAQINGGVLIHDARQYLKAIETYRRIISHYPNSAWALYELYFSTNTRKIKRGQVDAKDRADWDATKWVIYKANPMYDIGVKASSGLEGYRLLRRGDIRELFTNEDEINLDFIKLADIALDLEVHGFAAHFYWLALTGVPKKDHGDRELLFYFLYCLDKLGDTALKKNFKGDMDAEFSIITKARQTIMEENKLYKSFQHKK